MRGRRAHDPFLNSSSAALASRAFSALTGCTTIIILNSSLGFRAIYRFEALKCDSRDLGTDEFNAQLKARGGER